MTLIALASAKGAPGVTCTSLALAMTWPGPVVVAECDPAGGDLLAGYFRGALPARPGVLTAATATTGDMAGPMVALDADRTRLLLPGLTTPGQAPRLAVAWGTLADRLAHLAVEGRRFDVLADCGRFGAAHAPVPLLRRAHVVVLVVRAVLPMVRAVQPWVERLQRDIQGERQPRLGVVTVGAGSYPSQEVAARLGLADLGAIAWDQHTAAVFTNGAPQRRPRRSRMLRTVDAVGQRVRALADSSRDDRPTAGLVGHA